MNLICMACGNLFKTESRKQLTCSRSCGAAFKAEVRLARAKGLIFTSVVSGGCVCWPWDRLTSGYGVFTALGVRTLAHRLSYQMIHGPIPEGLHIRHKCDNPPCINPMHLQVGTPADNGMDRVLHGRSCRGMKRYNAKLSDEAVREIRRGTDTVGDCAKRFGVSHSIVSGIRSGIRWRHVS